MNVWHETVGEGIWLVGVNGRLDQTLNPELERQLMALLDDGKSKLIVDFTQVSYINSGGLRALVTGWRKAQQQAGDLVLCGLNGRIQEVFDMVGFDQLFKIFPDRQAAQDSLG
ncbi:MAG: anti-sigma factor antagonist [Ardenticatenaceae bacterium]|nr:MAG: anti-sigma factor antagonist [Ardenticatenaceae bacterium]